MCSCGCREMIKDPETIYDIYICPKCGQRGPIN